MSADLSNLDRLLAIDDLRGLQARLCRHLTLEDWAEVDRLFTSNGQLRVYAKDGSLSCFAESPLIAATIADRMGGGQLIVHAFSEEITVFTADRAEGIWAAEYFTAPDGDAVGSWRFAYLTQGYERLDGRWRIRALDLAHLQRGK